MAALIQDAIQDVVLVVLTIAVQELEFPWRPMTQAVARAAVAAGTPASLSAPEESSTRCFPQEIASETTPATGHLYQGLSLDSATKKIISMRPVGGAA